MSQSTTDALSIVGRHYVFRQFQLEVVAGPDKGKQLTSSSMEASVGTDPGNDLQLSDTTVSRHHLALTVEEHGVHVRDLGSTNGTTLAGYRVESAYLRPGAVLSIGSTEIKFSPMSEQLEEEISASEQFGSILGASGPMRRMFARLERFAETDGTVLISGETGTGKELVAEALHEHGPRADKPFVVVDCGAIPQSLIESELFGHVKGAFTGATGDRAGAFEAANGGTVFLDEIGELPVESQPKLLRVLESRTVRRVGSDDRFDVDVRIVAASNRDLREEVNRGAFRSDLYYRLGVLEIRIPPLRRRRDDIPLLAAHFYKQLSSEEDAMLPPKLLAQLVRQSWPGNVRELRAAVERALLLDGLPESPSEPDAEELDEFDVSLPFRQAKQIATERWATTYLSGLLDKHNGNITHAAKAARMDRNYLRELLRKYRISK